MAHSLRRRARRCYAVSGLRKYRRLPMVTLLGLVLSGCQTSGNLALTEADEAAIREGVGNIVAAANRGDFAAWAEVYAQDAVVMPPNGAALEGRPAIHEWLTRLPPTSDWEIRVVEVDGRGDLAFVRGSYALRITPPGAAGPIADQGKVVQIWRKQEDGSWKAHREIFNSDNPAPVPQ